MTMTASISIQRIRFEVAVTVGDGVFTVDFTGSSPQVRGPFNVVPSGRLAATCYALRAITDPSITTNGGCFRPITLNATGRLDRQSEGAGAGQFSHRDHQADHRQDPGAFAEAVPERVPADNAGELLALSFGGRAGRVALRHGRTDRGRRRAGREIDGVDVIETDATNCMNLPAEASSSTHRSASIARCCAGLWRAGCASRRLGYLRGYEILHGEVRFTHRGERHFFAAKGREGGGPGAMAISEIIRLSGAKETIPSKMMAVLQKGDRVVITTAGGGGNGPADQRDAHAAKLDLLDGKISLSS